jgi:L-cysteine:1D-myo-inositol 2-amino-2-deoxy-alpha-D-glucopyranoside ligase
VTISATFGPYVAIPPAIVPERRPRILGTVLLYDETQGTLAPVEILPRMGVYVCGITPYDSAHLGHAFTYVHFDVLVRYLRHLGADVVHVQNVTDVDDDILRVAKLRGVDFRDLAEREVASFERSMAAIGVTPPTHSPRATAFVPEMVTEVQQLVAGGFGYERDGTVYYRVAADPEYGKLSHFSREEMVRFAAERGGHPEDPNKDDPLDFVLWQLSAEGEPWWDSPWGRGRPGWHIECSTMARRLIGQPVDIHGGGSDLVFPHHESEIAQAEHLSGPRPFVRHWMHTGAVHMSGEKMSKSLGNLAFVHELLERHPPAAIRAFLLRRHYRGDWSFDEDDLVRESKEPSVLVEANPFDAGREREAFFSALDRDLDTPTALGVLDQAKASEDPEAKAFVEEAAALLGLDL